jgi:hypothetical protein
MSIKIEDVSSGVSMQEQSPKIVSVKDSSGVEIPNSGGTNDTTIFISGTAPDKTVYLWVASETFQAWHLQLRGGEWEAKNSGLKDQAYYIIAIGTSAASEQWTIYYYKS